MNLMYLSPLDQFQIGFIFRSRFTEYVTTDYKFSILHFLYNILTSIFQYLSFSRFAFAFFIGFFFILLLTDFIFFQDISEKKEVSDKYGNYSLVFVKPSSSFIILENFYNMALDMVKSNIDFKKNIIFLPVIFFHFLLIAVLNLSGLIPFGYTVTANLIVTFLISLMAFVSLNIISIKKNGLKYFGLFFPPGVPAALVPLLMIIEIISYYFRVVSLSVRLFANMMAGHTLFYVLMSFIMLGLKVKQNLIIDSFFMKKLFVFFIYLFKIILCFSIMLALLALETAVALIQAYVFTILMTIYINDALNPSH